MYLVRAEQTGMYYWFSRGDDLYSLAILDQRNLYQLPEPWIYIFALEEVVYSDFRCCKTI